MWGAQTLSNLAGIVSGPVALLGSRDGRTSRTSVGEREREGERGGGRGRERERDITYCPNQRVLSVESMQVGFLQVRDALGAGTRRFEHRVEVVLEQVSNVAWIRGCNYFSRITTSPSHFVWNGGLLESRFKRRTEFLSTSRKQFGERLEEFFTFG